MLIGTLKRENRILGRRARRIGLHVFSYLLRTPSYTISTFSVVEIAVCVCVDDWYKATLVGKLGESEGDVPPEKLSERFLHF